MSVSVRNGLIVAALHVALVASLGVKLVADRMTRPRVWARVGPVDPDLPIRGRYVRLLLEVTSPDGVAPSPAQSWMPVRLDVRDGTLVALPSDDSTDLQIRGTQRGTERVTVLTQPVAYFIPEHAPDPSVRAPGEELWVEVTVPKRGAPRPIRLGVKKDGQLTPLDLK
jgi:uncharacterized membrane-anchored protein